MQIEIAKAKHGDCIWLTWHDSTDTSHNMLIDSGVNDTFVSYLLKKFESTQILDAIILTHIDEDHISGFQKYLARADQFSLEIKSYIINKPEKIFFNPLSQKKSLNQAHNLMLHLQQKKQMAKCYNTSFENPGELLNLTDLSIELFSPDIADLFKLDQMWNNLIEEQNVSNSRRKSVEKLSNSEIPLSELALKEDNVKSNIANDCSIAFIAKDNQNSILLLGDSNPITVSKNMKQKGYSKDNRLKTDYVKLSHHGSRNNISKELISLIDSNNYIISTNGGVGQSFHPDRETLAKIALAQDRNYDQQIVFWFNYPKEVIEARNGVICNVDEEELYNFKCKLISKDMVLT